VSRHDPKVLYHGAQKLLRTTDEGEHWEEVSPDLTRDDKTKQAASGGPIAHDMTGVEVYDTIFALAESPLDKDVLWAGSDDGLIHVTRDGARTWQNVTPRGLPEWIQINSLEASPHDKATAYAAATMYKLDDFHPYLYKTADFGKTWTRIDHGIPNGAFTRAVREDTLRRGLLYAATETGLYVSFDDGANWQSFQRNLPVVPVTDLAQKNDDLVVATQGRAFWILDDLTPLRQWEPAIKDSDVHLFKPRPAVRMQIETLEEEEQELPPMSLGKNLPSGVLIDYWLKDKPAEKDKITLEILSEGKVIRVFTNEKTEKEKEAMDKDPALEEGQDQDRDLDKDKEKPLEPKAGLNRFAWDMRVLKPTLVPRAVFNEGDRRPPKVAPGSYQARLTVNGRTFTEPVEIRPHPEVKVTAAQLREQYELLAAIRDSLSETHETVMKIRDLKAQIKQISEHAAKIARGGELAKSASGLTAKLTAIEEKLINPRIRANEDDLNYEPKLDHEFTNLAGIVASADAAPLPSSRKYYEEVLKPRLAAAESEFKAALDDDLARFNGLIREQKLPPVMVLSKVGE
jgi:hypothetical protein